MRSRPVQTIIRDALNILEANEYIWYIVKDESGNKSLICDLTGNYFYTLSISQLEPCSVSAQTYQMQYKQPHSDKISSIIKTFTSGVSPYYTMTGLDRFQVTILSKIFTSDHDLYQPKFGIIKIDSDLQQLYLEFPLVDLNINVKKKEPYAVILKYLSEKLEQAEINIKPPALTALVTYALKRHETSEYEIFSFINEQPQLTDKLVEEYRKHCIKTGVTIEASDSQLNKLAETIVANYTMDQWIDRFTQQAATLVPQHNESHTSERLTATGQDVAKVSSTPVPTQKAPLKLHNHYGTIPHILFSSKKSAFKPVPKSTCTSETKPHGTAYFIN